LIALRTSGTLMISHLSLSALKYVDIGRPVLLLSQFRSRPGMWSCMWSTKSLVLLSNHTIRL
jgi:hypothetical protein